MRDPEQRCKEEAEQHSSALSAAFDDRDKAAKDLEVLGELLHQEALAVKEKPTQTFMQT